MVSPISWGEEDSKKSGYKYTIKNYFAKRNFSGNYQDYTKGYNIFGGMSFYRENTIKPLKPFSSTIIGFNQHVTELSQIFDLSLQMAVFVAQMENQRASLVEITPRITTPTIRTSFPLYIGMGAGLGFYPWFVVRKLPLLSFNTQIFIGLRFFDLYHNLGISTEFNLRIHVPLNELTIYIESMGQLGLIFRF